MLVSYDVTILPVIIYLQLETLALGNIYMVDVYSNIIHNNNKLEAIQMSTKGWIYN